MRRTKPEPEHRSSWWMLQIGPGTMALKTKSGASLMVQWLKFHLLMQKEGTIPKLGEPDPNIPHSQKTKA